MNHEAVYRTAPATPGLLIISNDTNNLKKKSEDPPKTFRIYRSQSGDTERFQQATS